MSISDGLSTCVAASGACCASDARATLSIENVLSSPLTTIVTVCLCALLTWHGPAFLEANFLDGCSEADLVDVFLQFGFLSE